MSKQTNNMRVRKKKKDRFGSLLIVFVVFLLCGLVGYNTISLNKKNNELTDKKENLDQQINEQKKVSEELAAKAQYMQTKKYVEDVAKEKLGLVYPDEIIIKPEE